ncbi:MAG: CDP-diacylglycerol--serine O-phosphatidyltransferase [Bacteroidales bacterium]|nr:CDP-diacylglycerol--serine O-phosphatidyltransferase [Bacteroidales bacterium]
MRRHIPNIITCLNLVCGSAAVILALWGYWWPAFCFILAGAVFDFCDGAAARLLDAYSDIGKELDSLSDMVTFGLAPALMLFSWYYKVNTDYPTWVAFVALIIAPLSAVRLARFNLDDRQKTGFIGLPTPALAMIAASAVAYSHICVRNGVDALLPSLLCSSWFIPVASVLLALLLVSRIPMFSLKGGKESRAASVSKKVFFIVSLLIAAACIVFKPQGAPFIAAVFLMIFFVFVWYLLLQVIMLLFPEKAE